MLNQPYVILDYDGRPFNARDLATFRQPNAIPNSQQITGSPPRKQSIPLNTSWLNFNQTGYRFGTQTELSSSSSSSGSRSKEMLVSVYGTVSVQIPEGKQDQ